MSDIPSNVDFVTSPETASPFNFSNLSTAFGDIQTPQLGTNLFNSQSSSTVMAPDEAISNAQSLATGSVSPIAKSQPVVSINVDTTKTFSFEKSFLLPDVIRWVQQVRDPKCTHMNHLHLITPSGCLWINMKFSTSSKVPRSSAGIVEWKTWDREFLCDQLLTAFSDIVQGFCLETSIVDKVKAFSISFDLRDNLSNLEEASCFKLLALVDSHPAITKAEDQECFNILFKKLPEEWQKLFLEPPHFSGQVILPTSNNSISDFTIRLLSAMQAGRRIIQTMRRFGVDPNYNHNSRLNTSLVARIPLKRDSQQHMDVSSNPPSKKSAPHCFSCGETGHYPAQCPQRDHRDRNHDSIPWPESKKGIQFKVFGYSTLPPGKTLAVLASESTSSSSTPSETGQSSHIRQKKPFSKGKCFDTLASLIPTSSDILLCSISIPVQISTDRKTSKIGTLLDTGSLAGDFISSRAFQTLNLSSSNTQVLRVCSGLDNRCISLHQSVDLLFSLSVNSNKETSFPISPFVLKDSPIDLIIGRKTIQKFNLFSYVPSQINHMAQNMGEDSIDPRGKEHFCGSCKLSGNLLPHENTSGTGVLPPVSAGSNALSALVTELDQLSEVDQTKSAMDNVGSFDPWLHTSPSKEDILSEIHLSGSPEFQKRIMTVCQEFRTVFGNTLTKNAATLKPFELNVDLAK